MHIMHYCIWRLLDQYFVLELLPSQIEINCVKKPKKNPPQYILYVTQTHSTS